MRRNRPPDIRRRTATHAILAGPLDELKRLVDFDLALGRQHWLNSSVGESTIK